MDINCRLAFVSVVGNYREDPAASPWYIDRCQSLLGKPVIRGREKKSMEGNVVKLSQLEYHILCKSVIGK